MKAADDQVTSRKGTKAIPRRRPSIAPPLPGGRCALRGRAAGLAAGLLRAAGRRGGARAVNSCAGGRAEPRLRDGGAGPAPEGGRRGERSEAAGGEAAAGVGGRGRPGLVAAKPVKSQCGGLADLPARGDPPRGRDAGAAGDPLLLFGSLPADAAGMPAQAVPVYSAPSCPLRNPEKRIDSSPPLPSPLGFPGYRGLNP